MSGFSRAFYLARTLSPANFLNRLILPHAATANCTHLPMSPDPLHRSLLKFLLLSAFSFFVGTVHGMLQVMPPIRAWLDSIGSPYGGPGHMIDPLAHARMNLVGGVVLLAMGVTFYLLPVLTGKKIYSIRLVNHTFWWVSIGVYSFYIIQMYFGITEGLMLHNHPESIPAIHHYYGPSVALSGTTMLFGFCTYLANVLLTVTQKR